MRRVIALTLVIAAVAATALAAFRTGNYQGTTGKGAGVSFVASAKAVKNFTFSVLLRCSNGSVVSTTTTLSRIPVRSSRFTVAGNTAIKGTLNGTKATGTLSVLDPTSPGGGKNCKSGSQTWTATRGGLSHAGGLVCAPKGSFNGGDLQIDMGCGVSDFDAFIVYLPRPATRADTSTAHLSCLPGTQSQGGRSSPVVNCSAQDGVKLKSGRVLVRFTDNATCADSNKTTVSALRVGKAEDGPFPLRTNGC
jgi:hypothetical protein